VKPNGKGSPKNEGFASNTALTPTNSQYGQDWLMANIPTKNHKHRKMHPLPNLLDILSRSMR